MALTLAKTLRLLAAEKKAVLQRQTALVASLNKLLPSIGYRVVPLETGERIDVRPTVGGRRRSPTSVAPSSTTKPLVCRHCDRTFALPLHLGRHISVMHKVRNGSVSAAPPPAGGEPLATKVAKPARKSRRQAGGRGSRGKRARATSKRASRTSTAATRGKE